MSLYLGVRYRHAMMNDEVTGTFGGRLRVRACGICIKEERILLVGHRGLSHEGLYWCPPGGGVSFGEQAREAVKREILEETGLSVTIGRYLFLKEFLRPPLHALELYFEVQAREDEDPVTGHDPELGAGIQLIADVRYMTIGEIRRLPEHSIDPVFHHLHSLEDLLDEGKWYTIQKKLI